MLGVNSALAYKLNVCNTSGQVRDNNNITIEGLGSSWKLPLEVNNGQKPINITSNGEIEISLNK